LDLSRADDGIRRPIGLREDEAVVSLEMLFSGTSLVQVLVSDRFHGAAAEPLPVDVPHRSPQSAILGPVDGSTVRTDANMRLRGVATASYRPRRRWCSWRPPAAGVPAVSTLTEWSAARGQRGHNPTGRGRRARTYQLYVRRTPRRFVSAPPRRQADGRPALCDYWCRGSAPGVRWWRWGGTKRATNPRRSAVQAAALYQYICPPFPSRTRLMCPM
jgi:hypothetical protein